MQDVERAPVFGSSCVSPNNSSKNVRDQLSIGTPEQIELNYDIVEIGLRFCASLVNSILIGIVVAIGWFVSIGFLSLEVFDETTSNWLTAFISIITFAILWGYYI